MAKARKLSIHQRLAIVEQWQNGVPCTKLAAEYNVQPLTISRVVKDAGLKKFGNDDIPGGTDDPKKVATQYSKFVAAAAEILRSQVFDGKGVDSHTTWTSWVNTLQDEGFTRQQAVVQGSKGFACLRRLYMKYDVYEHDSKPDSHPEIKHKRDLAKSRKAKAVSSEGRELSYKDNIRWAVDAAGKWLRIKEEPKSTPNDTAWFLFCMARDEPKDFMAKINQVESKDPGTEEDDRHARKEGNRMVKQLEDMISELSLMEKESDESN